MWDLQPLVCISDPSAPVRLTWQQMQPFPISVIQSEQNISVVNSSVPAGRLLSTRLLPSTPSSATEQPVYARSQKIPFSQCGGVPRVDEAIRRPARTNGDKNKESKQTGEENHRKTSVDTEAYKAELPHISAV